MPGFGSGTFGYGPFGRFDWAKQVLFRDLPEIDRARDAEIGSPLERWSDAIKTSFDFLFIKVENWGDLRDPDTIRTQFNDRINVTIVSSVSVGRVIEVTLQDPDPADPFNPIGDATVGWLLIDSVGREYTVNAVHKLRPNVVEVVGIAELPATGAAVLRPPALITFLGSDYGLEIDRHEPEAFQRSAVRNATQWLDLKGSAKSYDILGKISGYRVTPLGLWSIESPAPAAIPADHIYELPAGSGRYYTDIEPTRPRFDDVAADVVPLDVFCWEVSDTASGGTWDAPPPTGGLPPGSTLDEALGFTMQDVIVTAVTSLGGGRYRLTVDPADLTPIAWPGQWYFEIGGNQIFLETLPVETAPGVWQFEAVLGSTPPVAPGNTIDFGYECRFDMGCGFCRASVIRVEVRPEEVLSDPDALLDAVLTRLIRKIGQVVPVHVRLTDIVHIIGPIQIPLNITIAVTGSGTVLAYGPVGYYYDYVPADELPADPDHMVVTGTAFTVP